MKCQNCGHENPASIAFCENCGELLGHKHGAKGDGAWGFIHDEAKDELSGEVNVDELNFDKDDIDELEMKFMDGVEDWDSLPGNSPKPKAAPKAPRAEEKPAAAPAKEKPQQPRQENRQPVQKKQPARDAEFEEIPAARTAKPEKRENTERTAKKATKEKRRGSIAGTVAIILVLLAIAAIIFGIVLLLKKGINDGNDLSNIPVIGKIADWLGLKSADNGPIKGTEFSIDPNSPNTYNVTVRADEGTILVYETSNGQQFEHQVPHKNGVTFTVSVPDLLPVEPIEGTTCEVTPKVYIKEADGTLTPIEIAPQTIDVPPLEFTFDTPDSFEAENGNVEIRGRIRQDQRNAEITINNEPVTVNDDGSFLYQKKMDKGEYTLDLLAKLGGHTIYRKSFNATVKKILTAEEIVVIPKSFVTRALNVEDSIRVNGTVPKGTVISVVSQDPEFSLKSQPEVEEGGSFSFEVNLPEAAKAYPFTIVATLSDGTVYERPFCVERPPVYSEYVQSVWAENYEEMLKPVHVTDKRGFKMTGTIEEIIYNEDYLLAKMALSDGSVIEIEYHNHYSTASELTVGERYTMYGYSLGTNDEGMLRMFIWFVQD